MIIDPFLAPTPVARALSALVRWSSVILLALGLLAIAWSVDFTGDEG